MIFRIAFSSLIFISVAACCSAPVLPQTDGLWSRELADAHLRNRTDSSTWDSEMLATDLGVAVDDSFCVWPLPIGAFPVPKYELLGEDAFHGLGFWSDSRPYGSCGNHLIYSSFMVNRNKFNAPYLPKDKSGEVFFTIIVLSDAVIDTVDYSHCVNSVVSRNNPDFVGQGSIRIRRSEVDYIAFLTADRNNYALVNMRLFDLKFGRIVFIAPQHDGSLRSLQVDPAEIYSLTDVESLLDRMLAEASVERFLAAPGNI